jgi:hypothetical protein
MRGSMTLALRGCGQQSCDPVVAGAVVLRSVAPLKAPLARVDAVAGVAAAPTETMAAAAASRVFLRCMASS